MVFLKPMRGWSIQQPGAGAYPPHERKALASWTVTDAAARIAAKADEVGWRGVRPPIETLE
jgi:hypothetical protein